MTRREGNRFPCAYSRRDPARASPRPRRGRLSSIRPPSGSAPEWIRTTGLILRRDALYPAELRAPSVTPAPNERAATGHVCLAKECDGTGSE
jgi:hypothetical protein